MKFNPNRYDLILLFAVVSGIYYVIDETLNNAPPRRTAETLPVVFSVDASPQTAAGLVQGLIKSNQWCHVPVGARQAWDFALVDTELNGEAATAVYRLDGAPAWDVVYAPNNRSACHRYAHSGTKSSHNLVVHGAGGHQAARLSIRTQHAPAPLKRFGSVGDLRKWAHAGGAAAWRRAERLQHARWQLEVDEYRVAHGLVGDAE
jgi:hypothetical protein